MQHDYEQGDKPVHAVRSASRGHAPGLPQGLLQCIKDESIQLDKLVYQDECAEYYSIAPRTARAEMGREVHMEEYRAKGKGKLNVFATIGIDRIYKVSRIHPRLAQPEDRGHAAPRRRVFHACLALFGGIATNGKPVTLSSGVGHDVALELVVDLLPVFRLNRDCLSASVTVRST